MNVVLTRGDVRFIEHGPLENGVLDCRMQTLEPWAHTTKWVDQYLFDNQDQMLLAIEDIEYSKWLLGRPAYRKWN